MAFRHFLLDSEGTLYRVPSAALDRMLHNLARHRLTRFTARALLRPAPASSGSEWPPYLARQESFRFTIG
jgi:hypothetical protein